MVDFLPTGILFTGRRRQQGILIRTNQNWHRITRMNQSTVSFQCQNIHKIDRRAFLSNVLFDPFPSLSLLSSEPTV